MAEQGKIIRKSSILVPVYIILVAVAACALVIAAWPGAIGKATSSPPLELNAVHTFLTWIMVISGLASFGALLVIEAPYGRYQTTGWGSGVEARLAWVTQEVPSLLVPLALITGKGWTELSSHPLSARSILTAAFLLHYTYRSLIFPLLIRGGKPTPVSIWAMSFVFTLWNGFLQGWQLAERTPVAAPVTPRVVAGLTLWALGLAINMHSDHVLRNLRKPGETGYKIPHGGMFECVSGANYFGEILEWCGFALASWSLPAAAFALSTFCNLAPRAVSHHRWYKQKFEDYPRNRKAIIPFVW